MADRIVQASEHGSARPAPPADPFPPWLVRLTWVSLVFWALASWQAEPLSRVVQAAFDRIEVELGLDETTTQPEDDE